MHGQDALTASTVRMSNSEHRAKGQAIVIRSSSFRPSSTQRQMPYHEHSHDCINAISAVCVCTMSWQSVLSSGW
jgi:hypothetical protein